MEATRTVTAVYLKGDPNPLVVDLPPDATLMRLSDAVAAAAEAGMSAVRTQSRLAQGGLFSGVSA